MYNLNSKFDQMLEHIKNAKQQDFQNPDKAETIKQWATQKKAETAEIQSMINEGYLEDIDILDEYESTLVSLANGIDFSSLNMGKEEAESFLFTYATVSYNEQRVGAILNKLIGMCTCFEVGSITTEAEKEAFNL